MRANPERFATNVLLAAFAVLVLACGSTAFGIQWFVLRSRQPMEVVIQVSRGTIGVILPDTEEAIAVTSDRGDLEAGTRITTDSSSQGLLQFRDKRTDEIIAQWVLHRDSDVTLDAALAPRFGLNNRTYVIAGTSRAGLSEAYLLANSNRKTDFSLSSEHGVARLEQVGHYLLEISDDETRLTVRQGSAQLLNLSDEMVTLEAGQRGILMPGERATPQVEEAEQDLLANGSFTLPNIRGWDIYQLGVEPMGEATPATFDSRPAILFDRFSDIAPGTSVDHGEVALEQILDTSVEGFNYLELRASFQVVEQSLSTCGVAGSECPLMIRMDYIDVHGQERVWIHGFYAAHNPGLDYPLRCDTCSIDHERVAQNRWHSFESGNFLTLLPAEQKPATIQAVRVYASGHAFKLYISEINLWAGNL